MKFKLVKYGITGLTAAILCFIFVFFPILNSHLGKAMAENPWVIVAEFGGWNNAITYYPDYVNYNYKINAWANGTYYYYCGGTNFYLSQSQEAFLSNQSGTFAVDAAFMESYNGGSIWRQSKNSSPSIIINTPSANQSFSEVEGHNSIAASGTVNDADIGDIETIYYRIDGSSGDAGTQLGSPITANGTNQAWTGTINVASVAEGAHTLFLWAVDDKSGKSTETSRAFKLDKTAPTVTAPTLIVDSGTQMTVQSNASDTSGLAASPYQYNRDGTDVGTWQAGSYIDSGLTPNTQYTYKYKAMDAIGNVSDYSASSSKYTLALDPTGLTCTSRTDTSLTFSITNAAGQGETPSNRLEVKFRDAGEGGVVVGFSDYDTAVAGRVINDLSASEEYEVWCLTKNGDGVVNSAVKLIDSIMTNTPPALIIASPSTGQYYSEVAGFNQIAASGTVNDADTGDIEKVYYRIDGNSGDSGTQLGNNITADGSDQAWNGSIDISGQAEGTHHLYIWVADDKSGLSTESDIAFNMDKIAPDAPTITISPAADWTNQSVVVDITDIADNGGSGVQKIEYSTDSATVSHAGSDDVSATIASEGQHEIQAKVYDNVGHVSPVATVTANIDKSNPDISISGISQGGSCYSATPVCTVSDALSGLQSSSVVLTKNGSTLVWNSGNNISDPGNYTLSVSATDTAGNSSQAEISFAVEVYVPPVNYPATVTVTSPTDGSIYSAQEGHTAIQVTGIANDPEGDTSTVTGTLAGATKTIYVTQGIGDRSFTLLWDVASDAIPEGSQTITITAGGNTATTNIIVDKTAPEITFSGITEGATVYSASPCYYVTDNISGVSETSAILNKDGMHTEWSNDQLIDQAGNYSLTVNVTDAVGNSCTKALNFTIIEPDVTPPIITITGVTGGQTYYTSIAPLINVQDSVTSTVNATCNGSLITWQSGNSLSAPGQYVISITAVDTAGNQASSSVAFSIESISIIPQANTTDTSATIQWSSVPGATGYQVYRNGEMVYTGTSTSFEDSGLTPGTSYLYQVFAVTPTGNIEGETITVNTASQEAVSIGDVSAQSVPLMWEPVAGATEYQVYRDGILIYSGTDLQWTDTTASAGEHTYIIIAVTPVGNVEIPSVSVTVPAAVVPEIRSGTVDSDSATLTWDTVAGASEYRLYRDDVLIYTGTVAQYTDTNVQPGQSYIYRIEAITSSGTIELSPITVSIPLALTSINIDKVTYGAGESVIITVNDPNTTATEITAQIFGAPGNPTVTLSEVSSAIFVGNYPLPSDMEAGSFTVQYATSQGSPIAISGIYTGTEQTLPVNLGNSQLTVGSVIKITPLISGDATYTTSDPSVCTVDSDGTIHVVGSGEAIITIQVGDRIAEIRIIGLPQTDSSTANLVVEPTTATLSLKKTTSFKATLNGTDITDNAVWVADDSDIAEATAGQVTGLATGQTTITIAHNNTQRKVLVTVVETGTGTSSGGSGGSSGSGSTTSTSSTAATTASSSGQVSQSRDTQASGWANTANNYFEAKGLDLASLSESDVAKFIQDSIGGTIPATSGINITGTRLAKIVQDIFISSPLAEKVYQEEINAWASSRSQLQTGVTKDEVYVTIYWILQMAGEI